MTFRFSQLGMARSQLLRRRLNPATQHFGHAPCLGHAAAGSVRRLGVEDFADGADACLIKLVQKALQELARAGEILAVQLEPRIHIGSDQPRPNGALVIRRIARPQVAIILRLVIRVAGSEGAQPYGR